MGFINDILNLKSKTKQKPNEEKIIKLSNSIEKNLKLIAQETEKSDDIVVRTLVINYDKGIRAAVIFMDGVTDVKTLNQDIIKPLIQNKQYNKKLQFDNILDYITESLITVSSMSKNDNINDVITSIFDMKTILLIDGINIALVFDVKGGIVRTPSQPLLDKSICGPREGFVESIEDNIAFIRRKLRNKSFAVKKIILGKRSRSKIAIMYIKDIANGEIVEELLHRINNIEIDAVLSTGQINQLIEDNPMSPLPFYREVERADSVVANLLEGRIAILVDHSPLCIIYPAVFMEMLQANDDYYSKSQHGTFMRAFRYLAFFNSVSLPALYISLISFKQELIPFELIISMAKARSQVPFPAVVEVLLLEFIVQIIFEAGIRMPQPLGQTIGVVSGIILGQAIISANLASPIMIIIVSVATISSFAIPNFCMSVTTRLIRFYFIAAAAMFGIFGFSVAWLFFIVHLSRQKSMGMPYFAPYAPLKPKDLKDSIIRTSLKKMNYRPDSMMINDKRRQTKTKKGGAADEG